MQTAIKRIAIVNGLIYEVKTHAVQAVPHGKSGDIPAVFTKGFYCKAKDLNHMAGLRARYQSAAPFPHMVFERGEIVDGFHESMAMRTFPKPDKSWWHYDNPLEKKFAKDDFSDKSFGHLQLLVDRFHSRLFIEFLQDLTGINGLIPDPTLRGGGAHQIERGGKLDIHVDHNYHGVTKLDRRINVLYYLNQNWKEEWGGHLELWNPEMTELGARILPDAGRIVVFNTTDRSPHGHPDPLECPEGVTRKSLALYYWTNGRPEIERSAPHSTVYFARPQDPKDAATEALRAQRAKGRV